MAGKGGAIPGNGRKPKADEDRIRDITSPYVPNAIETIVRIMEHGEKEADRLAAAKLLLSYNWGLPRQRLDATSDGKPINITIVEHAGSD